MNKQKGLSLIEMMIAITIGMILLAGIANIFSANKKAYRYNDALNELHDNGNYALSFMANVLNNTGYVPNIELFSEFDWNSDGAVDKSDAEQWAYGALQPLQAGDLVGAGNDQFRVNTMMDLADPNLVDCVGNPVTTANFVPATTQVNGIGVFNHVKIIPIGKYTGRPTLVCNNIELIDGIEHMQILYGIDTDTPADGQIDRYLTMAQANSTAGLNLRNILAVKIGIIVSSSKNVREKPSTATWTLLGETVGVKDDRRLRKVMSTTVKLRNRCSRIPGLTQCS